jgi:uncharacterized protein (TIGR03435 family)
MRLITLLVLASSLSAQTFEVASVKPSPPIGSPDRFRGVAKNGGPGTDDPTRVRYLNFSVKNLIAVAYDVPDYQISGPAWTEDVRFVIIATLPKDTSKEQARLMLRNLLTERFQLRTHDEQKTLSLYSLVVAKNGPKLAKTHPDAAKVTPADRPEGAPSLPAGTTSMGITDNHGHPQALLQAYGEHLEWLVEMLSGQLMATVTDDTGLTETYDYSMSWVPQNPHAVSQENDDTGPTIFTALQDQLGLRLVAKKGPVRTIVIDHAEMTPSEN